MKKAIKTSISFMAILLLACFSSFAATSNYIYSDLDTIIVENNDSISIPVKIQNNTGIMGFKITVDYPNNILYSPSTQRGQLLTNGNYLDSISDKTDGSFDVLWTNSADIIGDGEMFVINYMVAENIKPGIYKIHMSFSQDDTFNEKWEDVKLSFKDVTIQVEDKDIGISENDSAFKSLLKRMIELINVFIKKIKDIISINN